MFERHYQMEWYKAAISYLPEHIHVAPDVGAVGYTLLCHIDVTFL